MGCNSAGSSHFYTPVDSHPQKEPQQATSQENIDSEEEEKTWQPNKSKTPADATDVQPSPLITPDGSQAGTVENSEGECDGQTSLFIAAQSGHHDVVALLVKKTASVNLSDNDGWTPLFVASNEGHLNVATELLGNDASVDMADNDGQTPLFIAAENGHLGVVTVLLQNGATANLTNHNGTSSPLNAPQDGRIEVVAVLLESAASVSMTDKDELAPLLAAARNVQERHDGVIEVVLSNGTSPDSIDEEDLPPPLISACRNGHLQVVQHLLKSNASLSSVNERGESPLLAAALSGFFAIADEIIQAGAPPHVRALNGESRMTAFEGTLQTLREYVQKLHEFQALWLSVADRLTHVYVQLQREGDLPRAVLHQYIMVIFRFTRVKELCEPSSICSRLVVCRNAARRLQDLRTGVTFLHQNLKSTGTSKVNEE
ncbi:Tkl protein kinase, partial [Globisporangium splendens]